MAHLTLHKKIDSAGDSGTFILIDPDHIISVTEGFVVGKKDGGSVVTLSEMRDGSSVKVHVATPFFLFIHYGEDQRYYVNETGYSLGV